MAKKNTFPLSKILGGVTIAAMTLLAVRVIDLQGFRGEDLRSISEENRQFRVNVPAERGVFLDRFGDALVMNTRDYFRYTDAAAVYSATTPLSQEEALLLQVEEPFSVGYQLRREYARPFSLAHVLGYISGVNPDDLENNSTLGLTDAIGRLGLEQRYNEVLRGEDGYQEFEINALGEKQAIQRQKLPVFGQSLRTTLDPYLATVSWRAMGEKAGAVVIMDADTGDVLSLVSSPSFDSNLFTPDDGDEEQHRLVALQQALADEQKLFFNRAVSGTYPPGSTFKLVTAVAGLESGAFDLETTVDDQGILEVGEYRFANWYYTQYGRAEGVISLIRAISRSNDTFFYRAAEWTGVEALVARAREFGFGETTGLEIPGEKAGLVPDPAWKEHTFGERWFLGNTYHLGIGQGDLLVTPLQLAQMTAVFGSDGQLCQPHLVAAANKAQGSEVECSSLAISDQTLAAVQQGMIDACSPGGTAFPFFDWNQNRLEQLAADTSTAAQIRQGVVACKTGTAEFGGEDERGYRRTHAWFGMTVGGIDDLITADLATTSAAEPESLPTMVDETTVDLVAQRAIWLKKVQESGLPKNLVIVVLVESDDQQPYAEGSREAAPVAKAIFDWLLGEPVDF